MERTDQGKDVDGKPFPKYSDAYKNSLDFKIAGKSSKVDLQLSGDMLAALEIIKTDEDYVEIGIKDSDVQGRAEGNIRGSYGKSRGNSSLARDFLGTSGFTKTKGISDEDLRKLVKFVKR